MFIAYVLISTKPTLEHIVYNTLLKEPEIMGLHPLFGEYDLIARIETESIEKLGEIVIKKIRDTKGVIDTKTLTGTILKRI